MPYNGAAKMYTDMIGGLVPLGFSVVSSAEPFIKSGQMKVLGVTDHGAFHSIYFFDPNGIRLELTAAIEAPGYLENAAAHAHAACAGAAPGGSCPDGRRASREE